MLPISHAEFLSNLPSGWRTHLASEVSQTYFKKLTEFLEREYQPKWKIYPPRALIFRAFQLADYGEVKVVILGQDPYHGTGQAIGLSFGVPNKLLPKPPSLKNIFKELRSDLGIEVPNSASDLTGWAEQGVLLLNTVLTVRDGDAFSHREAGWEAFTDSVIRRLNQREEPVIFILWGAAAQKKKKLIESCQHFILESAHPSPLSASRGFYGSRPFSRTNEVLVQRMKQSPIDWSRISAMP